MVVRKLELLAGLLVVAWMLVQVVPMQCMDARLLVPTEMGLLMVGEQQVCGHGLKVMSVRGGEWR